MKGIILYSGPSMLDGAPIVCIATLNTTNMKTGDMVQTWVLRADIAPTTAVKTGQDSSVCGRCPHRHFSGGACYVIPFQAPRQVWNMYHRGGYSELNEHTIKRLVGRSIRLGSYGDILAVPYHVILKITEACEGYTGYTHQMNHACFDEKAMKFCQASVETRGQYLKAKEKGWGTFRTLKHSDDELFDGEVICPNETTKISCIACGLCDGKSGNSIVIKLHGNRAKRV